MKFPRPRLDPGEFVFKIREMNVHKYQVTKIEIYPKDIIYTAVDIFEPHTIRFYENEIYPEDIIYTAVGIFEPHTIRFYENEIGEYVFLTPKEAEELNEKMKVWDKYAEK